MNPSEQKPILETKKNYWFLNQFLLLINSF